MSDLTDLAREAVACPRWRWVYGMLADCAAQHWWPRRYVEGQEIPRAPYLPRLDDRATLGGLEALVEEAWSCDDYRRVSIEPAGAGWCVVVRNGRHRPPSKAQPGWDLDKVAHPPYRNVPSPFGANEFPSRAAALVAALKAAP